MGDEEDEACEAAQAFREDNGLGIAPIADVVALIEQTQDADVTVLGVDDSSEHGLTMVDPDRGATIVAVASSEHPMRWRSTLAHELGHLVFHDHDLGKPGVLSSGSIVEDRARSFARHLLLPRGGVQHFLAKREHGLELDALSDLVQRFQVSPAIATIQLLGIGAIGEAKFEEWSKIFTPTLAARFGWADQYRGLQAESGQRRAPQRLLARVIAGYVSGLLSLETVASVRGISPSDLAIELESAGIRPLERAEGHTDDDLVAGVERDLDLSWLDDE